MNNSGQVVVYGLMLGMVIIVLTLAMAPVGQSFINDAMNASTANIIGLDCDNTSDNFVKGACVVADFSIFYFFGGLIFIAGAIITARIIF